MGPHTHSPGRVATRGIRHAPLLWDRPSGPIHHRRPYLGRLTVASRPVADWLVIEVGTHTHFSRFWPAGQNHAGFPGLLEPWERTEQTSPLGAGTPTDERDAMV